MTAAPAGARILVVDDDPGLLRAVLRILSPHHEVRVAHGVAEALELLGRASFDIAILDVQMPDGDGYELNRELHRLSPETDVILMTGSTSQQDRKLFRALDEDVFYFLFKPFHRRVLTALVERCLRHRRLDEENKRYLRRLTADQEQARKIQRQLLPATPLEGDGWYVGARFHPCEEVSGDLYAVFPAPGGATAVAVVDIVGHGLPAAMYAGMLRASLDSALRLEPGPEAVFGRLFEGLGFFAANSGASMFYGLLEPDGRLRYFSAGHPSVLLQSAGGLERLCSTGPILSPADFVAALPREAAERRLGAGDRLLVYTDGVTEARDPAGEGFGLDDLERALASGRPRRAEASLDTVMAALDAHCAGRPLEDDVTLLLVERRGRAQSRAAPRS